MDFLAICTLSVLSVFYIICTAIYEDVVIVSKLIAD